ncbi:MAG: toxin-antitoxin system YwqK family antitoxin [Nitrososphaerales archaeon]
MLQGVMLVGDLIYECLLSCPRSTLESASPLSLPKTLFQYHHFRSAWERLHQVRILTKEQPPEVYCLCFPTDNKDFVAVYEIIYEEGLLFRLTVWHNGKLRYKVPFQAGLVHGYFYSYYSTGQLLYSARYKQGIKIESAFYRPNGRIEQSRTLKETVFWDDQDYPSFTVVPSP